MMKQWEVGAYVYVIGTDAGPFKIGWSGDPKERLVALQCSTPVKLNIQRMAWFYSAHEARNVEKVTHGLLATRRIKGEWFDVDPDEAVVVIRQAAQTVLDRDIPKSRIFVRYVKDRTRSRRRVKEVDDAAPDDVIRTCTLPDIVEIDLDCDGCGHSGHVSLPLAKLSSTLRCSNCNAISMPF